MMLASLSIIYLFIYLLCKELKGSGQRKNLKISISPNRVLAHAASLRTLTCSNLPNVVGPAVVKPA